MLLSVDEKKKYNKVLFAKITENELLLNQAIEELKEVNNLLDNLTDFIRDETIIHCEHMLPEIIIPSNMKGINKKKFEVYVEGELLDKVKKILRKVLHFVFGSCTDNIDYFKSEIDYLERIKKSLIMYHRMFNSENEKFDKANFLRKNLAVWSYEITDQKTRSIKDLLNLFEQILQKDKSINKDDFDIKKFNDILVKLGYTFDRENKKVVIDENNTFDIEKQVVEDLKWNYDKVKDQTTFLISIFESRKVFDKLIDKMEEIKSQSKKMDNQLNSINDKDKMDETKNKVYDIKDEVVFIESIKKVIFKHLHTLSHQCFILIKNMMKS